MEPAFFVIQNTVRKRLLHHRLRAVDLCIPLVQQILSQCLPGQLHTELKSLDDTIADGIQAHLIVINDGLNQSVNGLDQLFILLLHFVH